MGLVLGQISDGTKFNDREIKDVSRLYEYLRLKKDRKETDSFNVVHIRRDAVDDIDMRKWINELSGNEADESERAVLRRLFHLFDIDGDGRITAHEFALGLSVMAKGNLREKAKFMFELVDRDGNGYITKEEYQTMMRAVLAAARKVDDDDVLKDFLHYKCVSCKRDITGKYYFRCDKCPRFTQCARCHDEGRTEDRMGINGGVQHTLEHRMSRRVDRKVRDTAAQIEKSRQVFFTMADKNNDGRISREEWIEYCEKNKDIMEVQLNATSTSIMGAKAEAEQIAKDHGIRPKPKLEYSRSCCGNGYKSLHEDEQDDSGCVIL
eukprot:TRINITY_DN95785_c0_g1_i1.p2 TRINITY_DN95785_c0_g1~~TRINITY_DN95785_c0_g1_i1.p2  ORF type:complete len:322 (-),score=166.05 TRINITY_DN95785_c0_g1_i1:64-1029(-)